MPPRESSTSRTGRDAGFTLTELVLVIAVLGILAGVGAVRFFDTTSFREGFYAGEVRAALSWARKLAVASGCEVQVTIAPSGYELLQRASCSGAFSVDVPNPGTGAATYANAPPPGVTLSSSVSPIVFDALGRARDSGGSVVNVTVSVGSHSIETVGETGFVHAPGV